MSAAETTEITPRRGMVVADRDGDRWKFGNTRWTCLTVVDGRRVTRVARMHHAALVAAYGPLQVVQS